MQGSNLILKALALTMLFTNATEALFGADAVVIQAKHIVLGTGKTISPGAILIEDGKIKAVADEIIANDVKVISADWVMPGLVNAAATYGISGGSSEISVEVAPDFYTSFSLNPKSRDFKEAVDAGITTAHVLPGTQSVIAGLSAVVKTSGSGAQQNEPKILAERLGLTIAMNSEPTARNQARGRPDTIFMRQPTNRMGVVWILRSTFHRTQSGQPTPYLSDSNREIVAAALKGELPIFSVSRKDVDIRSNFTLQDEFGIKPVIVGGDESYRILDSIAERKPTIVFTDFTLGSSTTALRGIEGTQRRWNVASQLIHAGATYCIAGENPLDHARMATRFGLDRDLAIASITSTPAKVLKLDHMLGTIEKDKDADLVAFQGDPLEFTSPIQWVMINGKSIVISSNPE